MNILHILILITISEINGFEKTCPESSQWEIRSKLICKTMPEYYCLFDDNAQLNREFCRANPDFLAPGNKYVIRGNLDGEDCEKDRFQPFIYRTNGNSKCALLKSECKEEGQITYRNGSTIQDRSCRCDYTKDYAFVVQPKNPCYCDLSTEDCSCFIKKCPIRTHLSADYVCVSDYTRETLFSCELIHGSGYIGPRGIDANISNENISIGLEDYFSFLWIVKILVLGFCVTGILCIVYIAYNEETEKPDSEPLHSKDDRVIDKGNTLTNIEISQADKDAIKLKCRLNQNLPSNWQVKRKNYDYYETLIQNKRYQVIQGHEPSLIIRQPNSDDAGDYICKISTQRIVLETNPFNIDRPLIVSSANQEIQCNAGDKVTLNVDYKSSLPITAVYWERDSTGEPECTLSSSYSVKVDEDCSYTCIVTNVVGNVSTKFYLRVNCRGGGEKPDSVADDLLDKETNGAQAQAFLDEEIRRLKREKEQFEEDELRVAMIGKSGAGKSSTVNTILGTKIFVVSASAMGVTRNCQWQRHKVCERNILLIDTPGLFGDISKKSDIEEELKRCVILGSPGLHAVLFVFKIGRYTPEDECAIKVFTEYFGESIKKHFIIVFTHVDSLVEEGKSLEEYIDRSKELKQLVQECDNRYVGIDNKSKAKNQVAKLIDTIVKFQEEKEYAYSRDVAKLERKLVEDALKQLENGIVTDVINKLTQFANTNITCADIPEMTRKFSTNLNILIKQEIKKKGNDIIQARARAKDEFLKKPNLKLFFN